MNNEYLFTSARLGFREWNDKDIDAMAKINADHEVMAYFPSTASLEQTTAFVGRMRTNLADTGYCYFAVETLADKTFIRFIGLMWQTYEADFTPCADIGWRLAKEHWHKGYATEGARRCIEYAFDALGLHKIVAVAPVINLPSINVMQRAGMQFVTEFEHPLLVENERLKKCVRYEIVKAL